MRDIYREVTDKIVAQLEQGTRPWVQPWAGGNVSRPLRSTGEAYKGINVLLLWAEAMRKGYASPIWITYKQAQAIGGQVRKGEHGSTVVYAATVIKSKHNDVGEIEEHAIPFMRAYTVFNTAQVDGLPDHFYPATRADRISESERNARADQFVSRTGAKISEGGLACYSPSADQITMPRFGLFRSSEDYYSTILHELTHWTRHERRLAREFGGKRFGDEGYAMEELVAEIGAAYLCADLGVTPQIRDDHASYIASWLKALRNDKRAIFTAASHSQKAVDYLIGLQSAAAEPLAA